MNWNLNYSGIAQMWRGGCIIKSVFLGDITAAYTKTPKLESLLFDDFFNKGTQRRLLQLRYAYAGRSCAQGPARLETRRCAISTLGNPHPGVQHCARVL